MSSHAGTDKYVEEFIAHVLAIWATKERRFTPKEFNEGLWNIMKGLLQEFVQHMEKMQELGLIESLGANCDNTGWDYMDDSTDLFVTFTENARLTCQIMSAALGFMGTVRQGRDVAVTRTDNEKDIREILGCVVMHAFASILRYTTCGDTWKGINYAWRTMKQVEGDGFAGSEGAIASARCEKSGWKGLKIGSANIQDAVDTWLSHNTELWTKLRTIHGHENCRRHKSRTDALAKTTGNVDPGARVIGSGGIGKEIVTVVKDVFDKMKDDVIQKSKSPPQLPGAEKEKTKQTDASDPAKTNDNKSHKEEKTTESKGDQKDKAAAQPAAPAPASPGGESVGRADTPPADAAPATWTTSSTGTGQGPGQGPGPGPQPPRPPTGNTCTESSTSTNTNGSGVSISLGCTPDSAWGVPSSIPLTPPDPEPGPTQSVPEAPPAQIDPSTKSEPGKPSSETTTSSTGTHTPGAAATPSTPTGGKDDALLPKGEPESTRTYQADVSCSTNESDTFSSFAGGLHHSCNKNTDGSNDHSNTSSCSGGVSKDTAGKPDGSSTPDGNNVPNSVPQNPQRDSPSPLEPVVVQTGSTIHTSQSPTGSPNRPPGQADQVDKRNSSNGISNTAGGTAGSEKGTSNELPPTHLFPKAVDPKDLVPYVPAIIPAVVGIAIIAFFLWKYFAYLAKRRRTYRTVRDVPSPPLDEEILEHLQRADLPPPDYGYTMIRDRQPSSIPGRGRPPRVHKRTIMELHLEVLHECDAAAWENVKDDYLHILVHEFMGGNNMCTSSSDVCTPDDGLATHDSTTRDVTTAHSTNRDLPIDSDGTDPCPPHDPDPWSCMETIQLATDPCRPHDPDPWSCMETMELATDRAPPHAEDRWNCMESIQLHAQQSRAHSDHGDETSACTHWINWIDRNKYFLRACATQPWFLQLKADWKQYLREHIVSDAASGDHKTAATMERTKLDAWQAWVAKQHDLMNTYSAEAWFQHLLHNVQQETAPEKRAVPIAEKALELDKVMAAEDILRVRVAPCTQLHQQPYCNHR
ncbi:hypothetical protein AK88_04615 [Plasmodium fragile]|uniref:Schizont-infected cell agglutination C-terminal domain-containing protein n=1 Tax=Plasmodium fragile TaxID=5857 RepID=A0A0D9QFD5_PLAFR|nr:uncharacterized protein AK88_04615 [Plasmodium fragile]KJP85745.1 hypothetical protein AK88_04615 [Plasmodium fragile]